MVENHFGRVRAIGELARLGSPVCFREADAFQPEISLGLRFALVVGVGCGHANPQSSSLAEGSYDHAACWQCCDKHEHNRIGLSS